MKVPRMIACGTWPRPGLDVVLERHEGWSRSDPGGPTGVGSGGMKRLLARPELRGDQGTGKLDGGWVLSTRYLRDRRLRGERPLTWRDGAGHAKRRSRRQRGARFRPLAARGLSLYG